MNALEVFKSKFAQSKDKAERAATDFMINLQRHNLQRHNMKGQVAGIESVSRAVIYVLFLLVVGLFLIFFLGGALSSGLTGNSANAFNLLIYDLQSAVSTNIPTVFLILLVAIPVVIVIALFLYFTSKTTGMGGRGGG